MKRGLMAPYGIILVPGGEATLRRISLKVDLAQMLWEKTHSHEYGASSLNKALDDLLEQLDDMTYDENRIKQQYDELLADEEELDRLFKDCLNKYLAEHSSPS